MGQLAHLARTLGTLVAQRNCSCVVVDYSCPDRCGEWVLANHPSARVVRVGTRTEFHRAQARNLGARAANAPWLCFLDAEIGIAPNFSETILPVLRPGAYYCPDPPLDDTAGVLVCAREDFERAGGYDEVPASWTEVDDDLRDGLDVDGARRVTFPAALVHTVANHRASGRGPGSIEPALQQAVNRVYRILKGDTARLRRSALTLPMRRQLYQTVHDVVTAALAEGKPGDLTVRLPYGNVPGGWVLPRSVIYRLVKGEFAHTAPSEPSGSQPAGPSTAAACGSPGPVTQDGAG
jgi:hypothetical protein